MAGVPRMSALQRFFWTHSITSTEGCFGPRYLNLIPKREGGPVEFLGVDAARTRTRVATTLPRWAARGDGAAPLGALLAILDQCSTFGGTVELHRRGKAGFSVFLGGDVAGGAGPPLEADAPLVVETRLLKLGSTLGFVDCDVRRRDTGAVLVRALHQKHFDLPLHHEALVHSPLRHVALPLLQRIGDARPVTRYAGDDVPDVAALFPVAPDGAMAVEARHCNGIGGLHGGAACCLAEVAAAAAAPVGAGPATSMRVTLMRALRAGATARCDVTWPAPGTARVRVADAASGAPCVDATVGFSRAAP